MATICMAHVRPPRILRRPSVHVLPPVSIVPANRRTGRRHQVRAGREFQDRRSRNYESGRRGQAEKSIQIHPLCGREDCVGVYAYEPRSRVQRAQRWCAGWSLELNYGGSFKCSTLQSRLQFSLDEYRLILAVCMTEVELLK